MPNTSWMKTRQTRYGAYAAVYILVILAVLGVGNWLASGHVKSVDLTANKQFTLSDQTRKVVGNLKSDINLYYFEQSSRYERAREMLDRYANLSSKLKIYYVDPDKKRDVAVQEGARAMGDLIFDNGVKKETAKALTEEELTGAIIRVTRGGTNMACFIKGSGEHGIDDTDRYGYSTFKTALEKSNYHTQSISFFEKADVPKECTIVVIGGPKRDYQPPSIEALKAYVAAGGRLVVNLDPVLNLPPPNEKLGDTPNLVAMLTQWGFTVKGDVLLDGRGEFLSVADTYSSHPIVRVLAGNYSLLPMARSMEVKTPAEQLFSSTAGAYSLTNPKLPLHEEDLAKATKGPFVLSAAATIGADGKAGRVVVTGSSEWICNGIIGQPVANRDLALNIMNWMTSDEDLISIRPKEPEDRRLQISDSGIRTLFFTSVIGLPLIVILSGVSVWWKRR